MCRYLQHEYIYCKCKLSYMFNQKKAKVKGILFSLLFSVQKFFLINDFWLWKLMIIFQNLILYFVWPTYQWCAHGLISRVWFWPNDLFSLFYCWVHHEIHVDNESSVPFYFPFHLQLCIKLSYQLKFWVIYTFSTSLNTFGGECSIYMTTNVIISQIFSPEFCIYNLRPFINNK